MKKTVKEKVSNGSRYCLKCDEFLGATCDPFGRSECSNDCYKEEIECKSCGCKVEDLEDGLCSDCWDDENM